MTDLLQPDHDAALPATDAVLLALEGGHRIAVRPSGTEPKLKLYGEAVVGVVDSDLASARAMARSRLGAALDAMSEIVDA
jgi:phosphomannomutase